MLILATSGPHAGQVFRPGADGDAGADGPIAIGREQGHLALADPRVSRRHCQLRVDPQVGGWVVEDLGSVNGTYLNGRRIDGPTPVGNGDTLLVGRSTLVLAGVTDEDATPVQHHDATALAAAATAPRDGAAERDGDSDGDDNDGDDADAAAVTAAASGAIVAQPRGEMVLRRAGSTDLGPSAAAIDYEGGAPRVVRRWLPAVVLGVLLLALAAMGMLYLRFTESLERMDQSVAHREQRDRTRDGEILSAIERQIGARSQSDRTMLLQDIATLLHDRNQDQADQQELIRELVLELRARSAEQQQRQHLLQQQQDRQATVQSRPVVVDGQVEAAAPAAAASPAVAMAPGSAPVPADAAPAGVDAAGDFGRDPDVIFFIDATGALAGACAAVRDELSRELVRLDLDQRAFVVLLTAEAMYEFRADFVGRMAEARTWDEALPAVPAGGVARHAPPPSLRDALASAVRRAPREMFVLSDTLGDSTGAGGAAAVDRRTLRQAVQEANAGEAVRVHALQFFARAGREDLKQLARENGGTYSYIPAPPPAPTAATASHR